MGLFDRFKQPEQGSRFIEWLQDRDQYAWVADYLDKYTDIRVEAAFADMHDPDRAISQFTMPQFKALIAGLYAEYLEADSELMDPEDKKLLFILGKLPMNITIRRVKPKASGNNWSVQYLRGTTYYGKTLVGALETMLKRNEKVQKKFDGLAGPAPVAAQDEWLKDEVEAKK